jgi:hypothetical protein
MDYMQPLKGNLNRPINIGSIITTGYLYKQSGKKDSGYCDCDCPQFRALSTLINELKGLIQTDNVFISVVGEDAR